MEKKFFITPEQIEQIGHYGRMFSLNAERINELASSEKDDVVYGFELGEIHSHIEDCRIAMGNLHTEILSNQYEEVEEISPNSKDFNEKHVDDNGFVLVTKQVPPQNRLLFILDPISSIVHLGRWLDGAQIFDFQNRGDNIQGWRWKLFMDYESEGKS